MSNPLSKYLKSIFETKENLLEEEGSLFQKEYNPYAVNMMLSRHIDTLYYAMVLNEHPNMSKENHYLYLLSAVRPKKRFVRIDKSIESPDIDLVMKHYGYNRSRAKEAVNILTGDDMNRIREYHDHGTNQST